MDINCPRTRIMRNMFNIDVDALCSEQLFQESASISEEEENPSKVDQAGEQLVQELIGAVKNLKYKNNLEIIGNPWGSKNIPMSVA